MKKMFLKAFTGVLLAVFTVGMSVSFAAPPSGFDKVNNNIPHGSVTTITYHSNTTGTDRKATVYTPPGYSTDKKYNVLYLLHGIGGDHTEWPNGGSPNVILDNLYAQNKLSQMIVIMPNGRAMADDRPVGDIYSADKQAAFENFQNDLIKDLIPYVESKYPVLTNRVNRAIAGLSMGGGQSLNFGLKYMDYFAYAGGFSPAPNTYAPSKMVPNPADTAAKMKVIWIGCGEQDGLYSTAQGVHNYMTQNNVPHVWYSAPGYHDFTFWKDSLYQFSQLIFKGIDEPVTPKSAFALIEAESFDGMSGIETETCSEGGQNVGFTHNGDYAVYKSVDFKDGAASFTARVASATEGGNIELRLDSITGTLIGTCVVKGTNDWQTYTDATCSVSGVSGKHDLYLKFTGGEGYLINLNSFKFNTAIIPQGRPGDVNGDLSVDAIDLTIIKKHLLGAELIQENYRALADVDNSGTIDSIDFALVKQYLLGIITKFPVQN